MRTVFASRTSRVLVVALALSAAGGGSRGEATGARPTQEPLPAGGVLRSERPARIALGVEPGRFRELTVRLMAPARARAADALPVRVARGDRTIAAKALHDADPDLFLVLEPSELPYELTLGEVGTTSALSFEVRLRSFEPGRETPVVVEAEPNDRPEQATPFEPGSTVFASADDRPFIRHGDDGAAGSGVDWYRFRLDAAGPRLVFLWLELLDREVPVDVDLFRLEGGEPVPHEEGFERFEPERSTRFVGMDKLVARRVGPGRDYYVRVLGNHPAYQLRSDVHPLPPFDPEREGGVAAAARKAIRVAADYALLKGDSWHANTPRVGAVADRVRNAHAETAQCVACHPTHFSTRGALVAAGNGYPVRQRASLLFLTERLYNNPRPFYGHPGAAWARMISAAANVLSRLSVILGLHERDVSGRPRDGVHREVGEYLKLYYAGREELPADESNGNRPLVSAFEVATHAWMVFEERHRRSGEPEDAAWRDRIRALIEAAPAGAVEDLLDLCYQTIAFARIDPAGYRRRIDENVERIFSYQRPDGQWPMGLGDEDPSAEFQTGHALYALALAGVPADDPRVERAVRYLLARQHPFGGWYDDDDPDQPHPYENFSTPFRETQFAVMALSQLFPGDGGRGWHGGFAPVAAELETASVPETLAALDVVWETPAPAMLDQIASALGGESVLVRQAAAACLGRVGGEAAVEPLVSALEDPSKLVQRAAAWALRQLGNRGVAREAVARALGGDSPRRRRAALQVVAQHHRDWTGNGEILDLLLGARMADPDPFVRMMASRSLWQWWYWEDGEAEKSRIEDAFLERMAVEEHPWVLANLREGFYNICDENTRYLDNNWIPRLGREADRLTATAAHRASSRRQAEKIAAVLRSGPRRQVRVLLEALGSFHLRSGTYDQPGRYHRIGNDIETVQFYDEGAELLREPLVHLIGEGDAEARRLSLLAGYTLRGTTSESALALPWLRALGDPDEGVRELARDFHREFPPAPDDPALLEALTALLAHPEPSVQGAALDLIGELRLPAEAASRLAETVEPLLVDGPAGVVTPALKAVIGLPALWSRPPVARRIAADLGADDWERRRAALHSVLRVDALATLGMIRGRLERLLSQSDPELQKALLQMAASDPLLARNPRLADLVSNALAGDDGALRRQALDLVRRNEELQANAAVREALAPLLGDANFRTRQIARAIYTGETVAYRGDVSKLLDFGFFAERVQPVLLEAGPDGRPCAECHHNHGILKLTAPEDVASATEAARANYRSALKVVNLEQPERSLILQKPISTAATEGVVDAAAVSHGGSVRWPEGVESPQYRVILEWINGARAEGPREGEPRP